MTYQIKVTLNRIRPPVWRRLLVPESMSLAELHDVFQVAMGWTDSHLPERFDIAEVNGVLSKMKRRAPTRRSSARG